MSDKPAITDDDILQAMYAYAPPMECAREVVRLFARRVGSKMTDEEIEAEARVILSYFNLPFGSRRNWEG